MAREADLCYTVLSGVVNAALETALRAPESHRYLRAAHVVEDGERPTVIAQFEGLDHAFRSLLAYGAQAEVLATRELRERVAAAAAETAALYAAG